MTGTISVGVFSFPSGSLPCAGVTVNIYSAVGGFLFNGVTDSTGYCTIALSPPQDVTWFQVIVEGPQIKGVGTMLKPDGTAKLFTQLVSTTPSLDISVTVVGGGTRDAITNNPIPGRLGISGATVTVFTYGGSQRFTGMTDVTGTCRFTQQGMPGDDVTQWYATAYLPGQTLSNQVGAQLIATNAATAQCQIEIRP